jgi:hypothetical protein
VRDEHRLFEHVIVDKRCDAIVPEWVKEVTVTSNPHLAADFSAGADISAADCSAITHKPLK